MRVVSIIFSSFTLASMALAAQTGLAKTKKAHNHGHAELDVAADGTAVKITLEAPSESIFGFEHAPKTAAQKKAVEDALKKLEEGAKELFVFAADAGCEPGKVKVESEMLTEAGKGSKKDDDDADENHSDVDASYTFSCNKPVAGTDLKVTLIKAFPRMKEIKAQVITGTKQFGTKLNAKTDTLKL